LLSYKFEICEITFVTIIMNILLAAMLFSNRFLSAGAEFRDF